MIASLVSPDVVVVETGRPSPLETEPLMAEEAAQLGPATIERRRREFAVGRACARRALRAFGIVGVAVSTGLHREPKWPRGVVGSITHCAGYSAAAVALGEHVAGIGIDAEVNVALPRDLVAMVCTPAERRWLQSAPDTGINWPTLIFSAKESIFKAWFPLARRWLGFEDAELTLDPVSGGFSARLLVPLPNSLREWSTPFAGRFVATQQHVFTAVVIPNLLTANKIGRLANRAISHVTDAHRLGVGHAENSEDALVGNLRCEWRRQSGTEPISRPRN